MTPWLFNVYIDGVMKEVRMGMGRRGLSFLEDEREWRIPGLLYADDLVLYGESEVVVDVRDLCEVSIGSREVRRGLLLSEIGRKNPLEVGDRDGKGKGFIVRGHEKGENMGRIRLNSRSTCVV